MRLVRIQKPQNLWSQPYYLHYTLATPICTTSGPNSLLHTTLPALNPGHASCATQGPHSLHYTWATNPAIHLSHHNWTTPGPALNSGHTYSTTPGKNSLHYTWPILTALRLDHTSCPSHGLHSLHYTFAGGPHSLHYTCSNLPALQHTPCTTSWPDSLYYELPTILLLHLCHSCGTTPGPHFLNFS